MKQAAKEAVDFPEAKGLVPSHRLPRESWLHARRIRDLPARGNQSMTCADREATPACLDSFSTESAQKVPAPG
jgi:hypothetical protein